MPKIRKVVTARFVAEVDSDEWAAEYGLDPADIDSIQSDIGEWLFHGTHTVITEMPGNANTLRVIEADQQVVSSEVAGGATERTWTFLGHWEGDRIVVEHAVEGAVQDTREDDGTWPEGLWAAAGTGADMDEAEANARAEYEDDDEEDVRPAMRPSDFGIPEVTVDRKSGDIVDSNGVAHGNIHEG